MSEFIAGLGSFWGVTCVFLNSKMLNFYPEYCIAKGKIKKVKMIKCVS